MDGAHRGTREELGVSIPDLEPVFTFRMNYGPGDNEISTLFQGMVDPAQVKFDPEEIQSIAYFRLEELAELMKNQPQEFCGWFVQIVHWYMGQASDLVVLAESPGVRKG